jgi:hypothetical protein
MSTYHGSGTPDDTTKMAGTGSPQPLILHGTYSPDSLVLGRYPCLVLGRGYCWSTASSGKLNQGQYRLTNCYSHLVCTSLIGNSLIAGRRLMWVVAKWNASLLSLWCRNSHTDPYAGTTPSHGTPSRNCKRRAGSPRNSARPQNRRMSNQYTSLN